MGKENKIQKFIREQDSEVDFIFLAQKIWRGRKFILKCAGIFLFIGVLVAFLSPKEYTASSTMVPQLSDQKSKLGALSGLAAIAGVSLSATAGSELTPSTYPEIVSSVPFQLELMDTFLNFDDIAKPVTLFDYYTKIKKPNLFLEYTIGLPYAIVKAVKGRSGLVHPQSSGEPYQLTEKQREVQKIMEKTIEVRINDKDGYITIYCRLPEAYAAAQLAKKTELLLQKYITEFKIKKALADEDFIQQRYDEAKKNYQQAQKELALFRDKNKNIATAMARTGQEQLTGEYSLVYNVYSELAQKLEQAKIEVKEQTPIFTVIKPVSVPTEKSSPNRPVIIIVFSFIGLFLGFVIVLAKDFFITIREKLSGDDQSKIEHNQSDQE